MKDNYGKTICEGPKALQCYVTRTLPILLGFRSGVDEVSVLWCVAASLTVWFLRFRHILVVSSSRIRMSKNKIITDAASHCRTDTLHTEEFSDGHIICLSP
jgi:hypothetical protein